MQRPLQKLARFRALPAADRRTLLTAMALLPLFRTALNIAGVQRLQAWIQRKSIPQLNQLPFDELQHIGKLVNSASHHSLGPANCLTRSLYLWWLLRRRGMECQLRIGVRLTGGALEAHAWVEHDGIPINDRADVHADFAPFAEPISARFFTAP